MITKPCFFPGFQRVGRQTYFLIKVAPDFENPSDKDKNNSYQVTDPNREIVDKDRTFFCSELVAKTFKVLQIIEDND